MEQYESPQQMLRYLKLLAKFLVVISERSMDIYFTWLEWENIKLFIWCDFSSKSTLTEKILEEAGAYLS